MKMFRLSGRMIGRMQSDVRLATVTLYCCCAIGLITPFAIFRLLAGDILVGLADLAIVGVFIGTTLLTWMPGRTYLGADLTAISASIAVLAVVYLLDISYLWVFSTLVGNFLMARLPIAVAASLALVVGVALNGSAFDSRTEQATFVSVATMASLFSLIFASRVASQHHDLSHLASRDGLTGAFNRRTLDQDLHAFLGRLGKTTGGHSLALMDLDNFKELNDRHGHAAGDRVLTELARLIVANTREKDRFYRYGGEEFVLLLPDTSVKGAELALNKLREVLSTELHSPGGPVTVSFGLAELLARESASDWLARADQALLEAKRRGKDRIVIAE